MRYYWLKTNNPSYVVMIPDSREESIKIRSYWDDDVPIRDSFNFTTKLIPQEVLAEARRVAEGAGLSILTAGVGLSNTPD